MMVYVFGNEDTSFDNQALLIADCLKADIPEIELKKINPNQDLPFDNGEDVVLLDTIKGINQLEIINSEDLDKISKPTSLTVHDFDLGFQLKYLKKIGKLGRVTIIGIPMNKKPDYFLIQSILRKLVAQDMQGS